MDQGLGKRRGYRRASFICLNVRQRLDRASDLLAVIICFISQSPIAGCSPAKPPIHFQISVLFGPQSCDHCVSTLFPRNSVPFAGKFVRVTVFHLNVVPACVNTVLIPRSIRCIYGRVFSSLVNLTSLVFEPWSEMEWIVPSAFKHCLLQCIFIPQSVDLIGLEAFQLCDSLTYVYFHPIMKEKRSERPFNNVRWSQRNDHMLLKIYTTPWLSEQNICGWSGYPRISQVYYVRRAVHLLTIAVVRDENPVTDSFVHHILKTGSSYISETNISQSFVMHFVKKSRIICNDPFVIWAKCTWMVEILFKANEMKCHDMPASLKFPRDGQHPRFSQIYDLRPVCYLR
jgi:hypothetical protein